MNEENGTNKSTMVSYQSLKYKTFKETPISNIIEKLNNNQLKIEDILGNDECILDIKTNQNTKFKKLIRKYKDIN